MEVNNELMQAPLKLHQINQEILFAIQIHKIKFYYKKYRKKYNFQINVIYVVGNLRRSSQRRLTKEMKAPYPMKPTTAFPPYKNNCFKIF